MPFAASDNTKICLYLGLPFTSKDNVQLILDSITDENAITEIQSLLADLATTETQVYSGASGWGIKKVGEIEFSDKGKAYGYQSKYSFLVGRLAALLGINRMTRLIRG